MTTSKPLGPSSLVLANIAYRHGVDPAEVTLLDGQGVASFVYRLGPKLLLRIPRHERFAADLAKEAELLPMLAGAGIPVPRLVDSRPKAGPLGPAYLVTDWVEGVSMEQLAPEACIVASRELGEVLARVHALEVPGDLDTSSITDARKVVGDLLDANYISTLTSGWVLDWADDLLVRGQAVAGRALIHGDAAPSNVLADPETGHLAALLDWGDAVAGEPATEFGKLPLRYVPAALDGYLAGDDTLRPAWIARILYHQLVWALNRLGCPPIRSVTWSAPPDNRILEILRFYVDGAPDGWR